MENSVHENPETVEFWFDPVCPWTWMTSRWIAEVSAARGFDVDWHPFSLKVLNESHGGSGSHVEWHERGYRIGRVVLAAQAAHGASVIGKLYTALGARLHPGGREDIDEIIVESLTEAGLPTDLAQVATAGALADETPDELDSALRASTKAALDRVGADVGVPIISVDGVSFFGPVVSPAPKGDDALKLWDGIVAAASVPGFFELKRGRDVGVQFD